jgi:hypothetical protein
VLGRIVVLIGSSGCLSTGISSFHLVAARETRVVGWCKGELLFSVIQVGAYMIGSWCWKHSGSWCFLLVGARETRELVLPSSWC